MGLTIGIDLGTTNTVMATEDERGHHILLNSANERQTRSVVGLHPRDGKVLIGTHALDGAARNPANTIFSIKRLMGLYYDDARVASVRGHTHYRIVQREDSREACVMLGEDILRPQDVSAMILRRIKEDAESRLGEQVTHAVITVPAYFSMNQKLATREAGELAGLRVRHLLTEPSAAALAFGIDHASDEMRNVLVYDLGGGTFDVTVLCIVGSNFAELAIQGNMWLGGDDFDRAIMDYAVQQVEKEYGVSDLVQDHKFMAALKTAAEKAKIQLSEMDTTAIVMNAVVPLPDGSREDVDVEITRSRFEGMIRAQVDETLALVDKALSDADMTIEQIDHVLLVGGSTAVPLVQRMLREKFGQERLMLNIDPMECVAVGAAIAGRRITRIICPKDQVDNDENATVCCECGTKLTPCKRCHQCQAENDLAAERCASCGEVFLEIGLSNVTAKPVGVLTEGDNYAVIVTKGTQYPMSEPQTVRFQTANEGDQRVLVPIFDADVEEFDPNDIHQSLGQANIPLEGEHLPAGTPVDVSIGIDLHGCLSVRAVIQDGSGRACNAYIDPKMRAQEDRSTVADEVREGPEGSSMAEWEMHLLWSVVAAELAMREYEWLFDNPNTMGTLERLTKAGRQALDSKDETEGRRLEKELDEALEKEFGGLMFLLRAEMKCLGISDPGMRNRVQTKIMEIRHLIRTRGSNSELERLVKELAELFAQATSVDEQQADGKPGGDVILKRM